MNKKTLGNLLLIGLFLVLGLTIIELPTKPDSVQEKISTFILDNLEDKVVYTPLDFQEVNESFLLSKAEVSEPFQVFQDSISKQLEILKGRSYSSDLNQLLLEAESHYATLRLNQLSDYLTLDARLKRHLKKEGKLDKISLHKLSLEQARMSEGINDLNAALGNYNLSIFSLNFELSETIIYLHNFQLSDSKGLRNQQGVFELDRKSRDVVSFKEVI